LKNNGNHGGGHPSPVCRARRGRSVGLFWEGNFWPILGRKKNRTGRQFFPHSTRQGILFQSWAPFMAATKDSWLARGGRSGGGTRARDIDIDLIIDRIFSSASKGRLPYSVPLPQMIDILVDLWEAEGLYD
ncbi:unnamed protein product, partial [Heterosigma akashiwo]